MSDIDGDKQDILFKSGPNKDELIQIDEVYFGHKRSDVDGLIGEIDGGRFDLETYLESDETLKDIHNGIFVSHNWDYEMRSVACYFINDINLICDSATLNDPYTPRNIVFTNLVKGISLSGKLRLLKLYDYD